MAGLQYAREGLLEFPEKPGQLWGVATSSYGNIFVVDNERGRVNVFSSNKKSISVLGSRGNMPGELDCPTGVASGEGGMLFVANSFLNCVEVFSEETGTFVRRFGQEHLWQPWDVATAGSKVYVADTFKERIAVFAQDGELVHTFGTKGEGPELTYGPSGLTFSPDGYLYVTKRDSGQVLIFTANGRYVKSIGDGVLKYPIGIDITEQGQILVANCDGNTVGVFDKNGKHLYNLAAHHAHGVAFSPAGYILVTERYAKQVAVFA